MQERVEYYDLASGIMLVFMMLTHVIWAGVLIEPHWMALLRRVFFFFMPWFFYKSGHFSSLNNEGKVHVLGVKKLLKSFIIWSFIGYVVYVGLNLLWGDSSCHNLFYLPLKNLLLNNYINYNGSCWFLLSLFVTLNIFNMLCKYIHPLIIAFIGGGGSVGV